MKKEKKDWTADIFESMKGSRRAIPSSDLFSKIQSEISRKRSVKIIPIPRLRWVAAVAAVMILLNTVTIIHYHQTGSMTESTTAWAESYNGILISSYEIYE